MFFSLNLSFISIVNLLNIFIILASFYHIIRFSSVFFWIVWMPNAIENVHCTQTTHLGEEMTKLLLRWIQQAACVDCPSQLVSNSPLFQQQNLSIFSHQLFPTTSRDYLLLILFSKLALLFLKILSQFYSHLFNISLITSFVKVDMNFSKLKTEKLSLSSLVTGDNCVIFDVQNFKF